MFFRKQNLHALPQKENLRRRFHHFLIARQKNHIPKHAIARPRRKLLRTLNNPALIFMRKIFFFVFTSAALAGIFYAIFFSDFLDITKVTLEKNGKAVSGSSISPFLDKVKGKNLLFLRAENLTKELEQTFKNEILLVRVKKSYPHRLIVKVDEYPAVFNLLVLTPEKNQKFVINKIGYTIFQDIKEENLPKLIMRSQKPFAAKSIAVNKEKLALILEAFNGFTSVFGMKIIEGEWKKPERELHIKTEKNFTVFFDLTIGMEEQLSKLKRALPKLDIYREPLEYIDLRISGADSQKVIFKRRKL